MFCNKCGQQFADGLNACPYCGAPAQPVAPAQPYAAQPTYGYQAPAAPASPEEQAQSKSILTFGILALVFACTFWLSFLGIIFGAIEGGKAKAYLANYGSLTGRAKTGSILGKIGLIVGIVLTAICILVIILIIVNANKYNSYYNALNELYNYYY